MKKTILAAIITLSASVALNSTIAAPLYSTSAAPASYSAGNIFIGFRASGGTGAANSYLLNLGNFGTFPILKAGATPVELFDVGSSLATVFGNDWFTRGQVTWGIFGMTASARVPVYSSTSDERAATPVTVAFGGLSTPFSSYTGMGANYNAAIGNGAYTGTSAGVLGNGVVTGTGSGTWAFHIAKAADFDVYNSTLEAGVATDLEFYSTSATRATKLTQFDISSSGVISVVPEPSTYALFGFGALLLIVAYRRKANA
jgi:hypothetical protein